MKRNRVLALALIMSVILSISTSIVAFASATSITLQGVYRDVVGTQWVGENGVTVVAKGGSTFYPVDYKLSSSGSDDYLNLDNNISEADGSSASRIILDAGDNYIYVSSPPITSRFGPFNLDMVAPAINLNQDLTNFKYIISESGSGLDYSKSGYEFSSSSLVPSSYSGSFVDLQGTLRNSSSVKYLHIKLVDNVGNEKFQTAILNTDSIVSFTNYPNDGYAVMVFGSQVNLAKTNYLVKSNVETFDTKSVTARESKIWFPSSGVFTVEVYVVTNDGTSTVVISDPLTITKVDTVGPIIEIDSYRKGTTVSIVDSGSGVDSERSYVKSLGDTLYFKKNSQLEIEYTSPTVELLQVVAYDLAGNSTTSVFVNKYLEDTDTVVDIFYEYRTFYLMAQGYTPASNLKQDTDKLYYIYSGTKAVNFQKSGMKDIKFYIDSSIVVEDIVSFDVYDSKEISWSVKNSQNWDLENSYYQRNGKGAQKLLKKSQYIDRDEFDYDLNFVRITLVDWTGVETVIDSRYFPSTYQNVASGGSETGSSSGTNTNNSGVSGTRSDGLKFRSGFFQYISGYPDGNFGPANPITRAEFAQILSSITDGGAVKSVSFTDVSSSDWFSGAITRMAGLDIAFTNGASFRPNDDITRAEAAAWLSRMELNPQVQQPLVFSDIENHPLAKDIVAATQKGLIYGYTDGTFKPDYRISRVEAVAIINRALGRASDQTSILAGAKVPPDMKTTDWGYYDVIDAMNTHTVGSTRTSTGYQQWTGLSE